MLFLVQGLGGYWPLSLFCLCLFGGSHGDHTLKGQRNKMDGMDGCPRWVSEKYILLLNHRGFRASWCPQPVLMNSVFISLRWINTGHRVKSKLDLAPKSLSDLPPPPHLGLQPLNIPHLLTFPKIDFTEQTSTVFCDTPPVSWGCLLCSIIVATLE